MTAIWLALIALGGVAAVAASQEWVRLGFHATVFATGAVFLLRNKAVPPRGAAFLLAIPFYGLAQWAMGWTEYRHATLAASVDWAALAVLFITTGTSLSPRPARARFLRTLMYGGAALLFFGMLRFYSFGTDIGPFVNRDHFAAFGELLLGIAIWETMRQPDGRRLAPMGVAALLFGAVVASGSRAGTLLATAEILGFSLLYPGPRRRRIALGLAGCGLAAVAVMGWQLTWSRLGQTDPLKGRREITSATLAMIQTRPWIGFGLGSYETVYPEFAVFDPGARVDHAHNDWLEWAAEGGLPLIVLLAGFVITAARRAPPFAWGAGVVLIHAAVDFPMHIPALAAAVFAVLGAAGAPALLGDDRVPQVAKTLDADHYVIARQQPTGRLPRESYSGRRSRRNDVAGFQGEHS